MQTRSTIPPRAAPAFRRALLRWYDQHRRDLPWRKTRDPYRIWLSEIMLQQTRVAAVLEHYRLFLERFPSVTALAAAPLDSVLSAWSGLGYYRRARMLHQCAQEIVGMHGGIFPGTSTALRDLPGIGRYTAAAIASITFDEPVAVVDGNVERVIQRLAGRKIARPEIWRQAQLLLNSDRPGDFNQSMMELGATVCLPRDPKCSSCPVQKWCTGMPSLKKSRRPSPAGTRTQASTRQIRKIIWCALDQRDGHVHLVQRSSAASLMPGMWELPQTTEKPRTAANLPPWRTFQHSITVTNYTVHVLRDRRAGKGRKVLISNLPQLPLTGLTRKILRAAGII